MLATIKHYIKILLGKPDPLWPLDVFENNINEKTWGERDEILAWADKCLKQKAKYENEELYEKSDEPLVKQGYKLKKEAERKFKKILIDKTNIRLLVHVPEPSFSPAGFSLFTNFAESFNFIGITTEILGWSDSTEKILNEFKPNILISSGNKTYLEKINWRAIEKYRKNNPLKIGLTINTRNQGQDVQNCYRHTKGQKIDFYYSFYDSRFFRVQDENKILSMPFGANVLHYYPVPNIYKNVNYVFLASVNKTKGSRYKDYMGPIVSNYKGFIDGPGWKRIRDFHFNRDRDRYIYARSKIGLNIHLEEQLVSENEVNERTYMLAACGIPQITDSAKLLPHLFSDKALFIADTPKEYMDYFETILENPAVGVERALVAQREVFEKHTTFHRAKYFIEQLSKNKLLKDI